MRRMILISAVAALMFSDVPQAQELDYGSEIVEIDRQIVEAEEEAAKYAGGLVLSMIKLRIETLRYSKAMIEHNRRQAVVDSRGLLGRLWGSGPSQAEKTTTEIGILCGDNYYGTMIIVRPSEKMAAISVGSLAAYSEADDEIAFAATQPNDQTAKCRLNRYTLELVCTSSSDDGKPWKEQCKRVGSAKIPDHGKYWVRCKVPGKSNADQIFKIGINEDSSVRGGYVVWKDSVRECTLNRYDGHILCDPRPTDWDILDKPVCQVLPRSF